MGTNLAQGDRRMERSERTPIVLTGRESIGLKVLIPTTSVTVEDVVPDVMLRVLILMGVEALAGKEMHRPPIGREIMVAARDDQVLRKHTTLGAIMKSLSKASYPHIHKDKRQV